MLIIVCVSIHNNSNNNSAQGGHWGERPGAGGLPDGASTAHYDELYTYTNYTRSLYNNYTRISYNQLYMMYQHELYTN